MRFPFVIHVVFYDVSEEREEWEEFLYSLFCRDVKRPFNRGLNIPIYFYSLSNLEEIDTSMSDKNYIILFINEDMVINKDRRNKDGKTVESYIDNLIKKISFMRKELKVIFVALTKYFYKIESIGTFQVVRLYESGSFDNKKRRFIIEVMHDIIGKLLGKEKISVFLSHSKQDGEEIARALKCYIESETKLDAFFDVTDIQLSTDWREELRTNIENSIFLAIQTDSFSSREWCKKEVLYAKNCNVPIVVVKAIREGEDRSFPYMFNVPTIVLTAPNSNLSIYNFEDILIKLLEESLRFYYQKEFLEWFKNKFCNLERINDFKILPRPPELLDVIGCNKKIVFYPDPPLGKEELKVLKKVRKDLRFITPLTCIKGV